MPYGSQDRTCSVCGTDILFFGQDGMCIHHYDQKQLKEKAMAETPMRDDFPRARELAKRLVESAEGKFIEHLTGYTSDDFRFISQTLLTLTDRDNRDSNERAALRESLSKERADNIEVNAKLTAALRKIEDTHQELINARTDVAVLKAARLEQYDAKFRHERLVTTARMMLVGRMQGGLTLSSALDVKDPSVIESVFKLSRRFWEEADRHTP